ncbi:nuclear transport factor 2 family protein [Streptomyces venezuelae]|uniref:nuclear transport factor 2 family protein n=1 Tax=Streptomyces venezuelae TaxID=54571 RepID=UPI0033184CDA
MTARNTDTNTTANTNTSTAHQTIAVLGLGRMGSAIATRLAGCGRDVVGWTRGGRGPSGITIAGDPNETVAKADFVLLSLFDGPACRDVLDQVQESLRPGAVVVNTSTIAPAEAMELARRLGSCYVHAPVLGSVPAVAAGTLRILAGAGDDALDRARPVLEVLGTVRPLPDAPTAATLKLIANSSLYGAVLALRDALRQADALGLARDQALDVLELGQLGGLVTRKRQHLLLDRTAAATATATATRAEFTIGALAKDMALLNAASGAPLRSGSPAGTSADAHADIALAALPSPAEDAVLEPLRAYVRGHETGDARHFRSAFLPTARIEGARDGVFVSWSLDDYCALFRGRPATDERDRARRVDAIEVHGTVATATMTLLHGADAFTDVFLLVRVKDGWRIANKAYHRHP